MITLIIRIITIVRIKNKYEQYSNKNKNKNKEEVMIKKETKDFESRGKVKS